MERSHIYWTHLCVSCSFWTLVQSAHPLNALTLRHPPFTLPLSLCIFSVPPRSPLECLVPFFFFAVYGFQMQIYLLLSVAVVRLSLRPRGSVGGKNRKEMQRGRWTEERIRWYCQIWNVLHRCCVWRTILAVMYFLLTTFNLGLGAGERDVPWYNTVKGLFKEYLKLSHSSGSSLQASLWAALCGEKKTQMLLCRLIKRQLFAFGSQYLKFTSSAQPSCHLVCTMWHQRDKRGQNPARVLLSL